MTKQKKQSFLYGASILMSSMVIVKLVGAIFKIPLGNILHETGMSYFSSTYTLYNFVYALTVTGLSAGVARMVAENVTKGRYRDVRKLLKLSTLIFLILGTLGCLFVGLFARGFSVAIESPNSYWSVVMIAPAIFFCCVMASYRGYYEGLSNMTPTAITQVVEVVTKLVTGLSFAAIVMAIGNRQYLEKGIVFGTAVDSPESAISAALPYGAAAAIFGVTISTMFGLIYIFIHYKKKGDYITKQMLADSPPSKRGKVLLVRLLKISIPVTLGAAVLQLSALIDMVTIMNRLQYCYKANPVLMDTMYGALLGPNEEMHVFLYGCFSTVLTIFTLVSSFTNIFGKSALPNVTSAWTARDKSKLKINIESVIRVTMLIAAPASFGISFLAEPIIKLLFPRLQGAIVVGSSLLVVLGMGALFMSIVTPVNAIMQGIGRMDLPVKYLFIGALIKLVMNIVLIGIPSVNIMGAPISTFFCYGTIVILSINKLRKIVKMKLDFLSMLVKPLISGFICGFSAFLCHNLLSLWKDNSIITILSICFGGLLYVISLGIFNAISKDDVLMLPGGNKILKTLEKFKVIR